MGCFTVILVPVSAKYCGREDLHFKLRRHISVGPIFDCTDQMFNERGMNQNILEISVPVSQFTLESLFIGAIFRGPFQMDHPVLKWSLSYLPNRQNNPYPLNVEVDPNVVTKMPPITAPQPRPSP